MYLLIKFGSADGFIIRSLYFESRRRAEETIAEARASNAPSVHLTDDRGAMFQIRRDLLLELELSPSRVSTEYHRTPPSDVRPAKKGALLALLGAPVIQCPRGEGRRRRRGEPWQTHVDRREFLAWNCDGGLADYCRAAQLAEGEDALEWYACSKHAPH